MSLMKMPIFVWAVLATMVLVVFAFPILTATGALLTTDRLIDTHIFTPEYCGNPMMYINLFWAWGHPEVYILVLPAFGIFSEVVPVFSHKRLFGYTSMVWAIVAITFLSFIVWLHHFFTMGAGANVNAFFGIMTMVIALPTGVKVFNWLFTLFRGRVRFDTPLLWFLGFVVVFTIGGMAGVLMSIPAADFQVHNSLFLIAHFHYVIIGGVVFGFFAGYTYWFPKFVGFKLNERLGKYAFWFWIIGFNVAFMPLYLLGFMGATRRLDHYDVAEWQPLFIIAFLGFLLVLVGFSLQILQLIVSIKARKENRDVTGDPWDGRTLEWSTASPPPFYNFAFTPEVHSRDPFWIAKRDPKKKQEPQYHDIHMPKNTGAGFYVGVLSFIIGFAIIWYMFWLALLSAIALIICLIRHLYVKHTEYLVTAAEVKRIETRD
jgi:cytochrome o ubiquinol oxidase subunit 1